MEMPCNMSKTGGFGFQKRVDSAPAVIQADSENGKAQILCR
jgi:hypothetical protein